jgi:hypothetical protein
MYLEEFSLFSTRWVLIMFPHQGHERVVAVMALNSRICARIKQKQEQNSANLHCANAQAKILADIRWAHKYKVLAVCASIFLVGERM